MIVSILYAIKKPLFFLLVSILLSGLIMSTAMSFKHEAYNNQLTALHKLNSSRQNYYTAFNHKQLLDKFDRHFQQLIKDGIFRGKPQINPAFHANDLTIESIIPDLKYIYGQSSAFNSTSLSSRYSGLALYILPLTLQMHLLHEGDLYALLNSIENTSSGLFDIQSCTIKRNNPLNIILLDTSNNNFSASCKLNWYAMGHSKTKPILLNRQSK